MLASLLPAFLQKLLDHIRAGSDIIPATVFELKLPQTSPDTREKTKQELPAGKVASRFSRARGQGQHFGSKELPCIHCLGGNKVSLLLHGQGGVVGSQTRPSGVQVSSTLTSCGFFFSTAAV